MKPSKLPLNHYAVAEPDDAPCPPAVRADGFGQAVARRVTYELRWFWYATRRDLPIGMFAPLLLHGVASVRYGGAEIGDTVLVALLATAYYAMFIFGFNIANQMMGIEEDRRNKPDRPLPRGMGTIREALIRWIVVEILFLSVGAVLGVLPWTIGLVAMIIVNNYLGWDRHWPVREGCIAVGLCFQLTAAWSMSGPLTDGIRAFIAFLAFNLLALLPAQDLRDMEGDRVRDRRTLPLLIGATFTRWYLVVMTWVSPTVFALVLLPGLPARAGLVAMVAVYVLAALMSVRWVLKPFPRADDGTYHVLIVQHIVYLGLFGPLVGLS